MLLELLTIVSLIATGIGSYLYHRRTLQNKEQSLSEKHAIEIAEVEQAGKDKASRSLLRSKQVMTGLGAEQFVAHMKNFPYVPNDCRALGSPVDFIVFDGAVKDDIDKIVIVEVKTGNSRLSKKQRQIKDAVDEGRVEFLEYRVPTEKIVLQHDKEQALIGECFCKKCIA